MGDEAPQNDNDFHVAIVGAGIAGLALAIALHNKNIPFTLYEEAKEYSTVGAGIGFAPNGMRAMDLIEPRFRELYEGICVGNKGEEAKHVFFEGLLLRNGLGQDEKWYGNSSWGHPDFVRKSAHRKALLDILTSFIPASSVQFNKRLLSISPFPLTLHFADGEKVRPGILAGADGIKSMVREYVVEGAEEGKLVYAGAYCYRAVIPMGEAEGTLGGELTGVAKFYFGHDRAAVTYRISGGSEFNYLLCVRSSAPWPSEGEVTQRVSHEEMMHDFADKGIDERFRTLLEKCPPIRWGLFHHPHTATYYKGNVVLLGDSAHASLPFQAAGAAQGVEDAVVLSSILHQLSLQHSTSSNEEAEKRVKRGLQAYDAIRRPRAQKQVEQSSEVMDMLFLRHEAEGADMEGILRRLQGGRFEWLWFHDVEGDVGRALEMMGAG